MISLRLERSRRGSRTLVLWNEVGLLDALSRCQSQIPNCFKYTRGIFERMDRVRLNQGLKAGILPERTSLSTLLS